MEQVKIWRRSYDIPPPELTREDPRYPGNDPRYAGLSKQDLPVTESLKNTVARFLPYWHDTIAPMVRSGKRVLIAAHGNSLRALVKYLDGISDEEIVGLNIPTGIPLVYELDGELKPLTSSYLGDQSAVEAAAKAVADQLKKKIGVSRLVRHLFLGLLVVACAGYLRAQDHADTAGVGGLNWFAYPYVFYTPETNLAFGAAGIVYFRTEQDRFLNPSQILLSSYYTINNQYDVTLNPQLYFSKNRYFASVDVGLRRVIDKFYGVGNDSHENGDEAYTAGSTRAEFVFQMPTLLFTLVRLQRPDLSL